jgi:hypothetical protein
VKEDQQVIELRNRIFRNLRSRLLAAGRSWDEVKQMDGDTLLAEARKLAPPPKRRKKGR